MSNTIQEIEYSEPSTGTVSLPASSQSELRVEASGLHDSLEEVADSFDATGFKCPTCGLAHMHSTNKHRASDAFDISVETTAEMEYNPNCHCGVNELARRGSDFGIDESEATSTASHAPIPDSTTQEMNDRFCGV
jgi:hypothetical protein